MSCKFAIPIPYLTTFFMLIARAGADVPGDVSLSIDLSTGAVESLI
jgi:hypothetical protein